MFNGFDLKKLIAAIVLISSPILLFNIESSLKVIATPFLESAHALQRGLSFISSGIDSTANTYLNLISVKKLNRKLLRENSQLKMDQVFYQELLIENKRLMSMLNLREKASMKLEAATVVTEDILAERHSLNLSKGTNSGVKPHMGVLGLNGIIGETYKVTHKQVQVMSLLNRFFVVEGIIQRSRQKLILEGSGDNHLESRHIGADIDIQVGDLIVTSGSSGIFPKGLPIGVVETLNSTNSDVTQKALIKPLADIYNTEEFFIIINPEDTKKDVQR